VDDRLGATSGCSREALERREEKIGTTVVIIWEAIVHPNVFLRTFWRGEIKPQVFVAMSFSPPYRKRYEKVIAPAIEALKVDGVRLKPYRVDLSKSGDSILSDIIDGIAHSRLVLVDLSTVGHDSKTGEPYRNGNVMYELGIAIACRDSADVLMVRDDNDKFLFDVSTIPHMHIDFTRRDAKDALIAELKARLREQDFVRDARTQVALASLSEQSANLMAQFAGLKENQFIGWHGGGTITNVGHDAAIGRLLDKQLIRAEVVVSNDEGELGHYYGPTQLGLVVAAEVRKQLKAAEKDAAQKKAKAAAATKTEGKAGE
jgi:hypothetical protein